MKAIKIIIQLEEGVFSEQDIEDFGKQVELPGHELIINEYPNSLNSHNNSVLEFIALLSQHPISSGIIVLFVDRLLKWISRSNKKIKSIAINDSKKETKIVQSISPSERDELIRALNDFLKAHLN